MSKSARSIQFLTLERELSSLRKRLLPQKFDPTGAYPDRILTRTIAYSVLAHAEFEEYIENRVWELALTSVQTLATTGRVNRVIACLIAFSGKEQRFPPETLAPPTGITRSFWDEKLEFVERVKLALNAFKQVINQNHGIREKNLLGLLVPVGIQPAQIDVTWLSTVDSFGQQRGTMVHHSVIFYKATLLPDPHNELNTIRKILAGLRDIDDHLNELRQ